MRTLKSSESIFQQMVLHLSSIYDSGESEAISVLLFENLFPNKSKSELRLLKSEEITKEQMASLENSLLRLQQHEPIQYVIGEVLFYGVSLQVNPSVLIPRPETEELCHLISEKMIASKKKQGKLLDIGTGSGCIAISLAKKFEWLEVTACDISSAALETAKKNALLNGVNVRFLQQDILSSSIELLLEYQWIVSNPPYITEAEKSEMESHVLQSEPSLALFVSNENPLIYYKAITQFAATHLSAQGQLWFEINSAFAEAVKQLLEEQKFAEVRIIKDLFGQDRFVTGIRI